MGVQPPLTMRQHYNQITPRGQVTCPTAFLARFHTRTKESRSFDKERGAVKELKT